MASASLAHVGVEDEFSAVAMTLPLGDALDVDAAFDSRGDEKATEGAAGIVGKS